MCSFGSTEFNLYSVRHSKAAIGSFITRIFAELCIILREINHPLTDGLCIISWRTNSVGQYTESRRLYSLLLGMEYGWSTSSAMYYTSDRARTLVAREVVLRLLSPPGTRGSSDRDKIQCRSFRELLHQTKLHGLTAYTGASSPSLCTFPQLLSSQTFTIPDHH